MDSIKDLLLKKADDFDDEKRDDVALAQQEIERLFEGLAEVSKIEDSELHVKTQSSPIASELRLRQVEILDVINRSVQVKLENIRIRIG